MPATLERIVIRAHPGPQRRFLRSSADIAIYGGAAGGGKTFALLVDPLRFVNIRGFEAVIFRRTSEQVRQSGGLWDESTGLYPMVGAKGREDRLDWRWPKGGTIRFEQLQHEKTKFEYQGAQIPSIGFDELTHFTRSQFFYLLSRNRSSTGIRPRIRCSCNPDASSWVAKLIAWWIDPGTGLAIRERSGIKRWFIPDPANDNDLLWADSSAELEAAHPGSEPLSLTFVPALAADNPSLDPRYVARLKALPRVERERLLGGNWAVADDAIIDVRAIRRWHARGEIMLVPIADRVETITARQCRRLAIIDTAGTSREKAEELKGRPPSHSVVSIWDYAASIDVLILRHIWRDRVGWIELKTRAPEVVATWHAHKTYVENAHHGPALLTELQAKGLPAELVGPIIPGMTDSSRGAKLERAIASGILGRFEDGRAVIPADCVEPWLSDYLAELSAWGGLPNETADQIDVSSYASWIAGETSARWGGVVNHGASRR